MEVYIDLQFSIFIYIFIYSGILISRRFVQYLIVHIVPCMIFMIFVSIYNLNKFFFIPYFPCSYYFWLLIFVLSDTLRLEGKTWNYS